ncbi:MAG TPA: CHRD domain-containing protein [Chitinophagaceae bacterium]|nr:CHRD domain-containing protein [Chitinophagaceae bacterium]
MTRAKMNYVAIFIAVAVFSATFFSCEKDDNDEDTNVVYNLTGNANGAQEAPDRVTTAASGTISGTYNKNTNILQYTITWNGLSSAPSAMHLHGPADPGVAAGVKIPVPGFTAAASGSINRTDTLKTDADEADFLQGRWYYNIHTPANPGGEIRGQIFPTR